MSGKTFETRKKKVNYELFLTSVITHITFLNKPDYLYPVHKTKPDLSDQEI